MIKFLVRGQQYLRPRARPPPFILLDGRQEVLLPVGLDLEVLHEGGEGGVQLEVILSPPPDPPSLISLLIC